MTAQRNTEGEKITYCIYMDSDKLFSFLYSPSYTKETVNSLDGCLKGLIQKHSILEGPKAFKYISKSFSNCKKR